MAASRREFCEKYGHRLFPACRRFVVLAVSLAGEVPPGNRLERLKGNRMGQHSIRINDQFRICLRWETGDAYEVEITDFH